MFKAGAVHLKKDMHAFIGELLDFPKGAHDDIIDAFWLATQFTQGHQKPGGQFKDEKKKERKLKKAYNWMTGSRT